MGQHESSVFQVPCFNFLFSIRQQGRLGFGADMTGAGMLKENGVKIPEVIEELLQNMSEYARIQSNSG